MTALASATPTLSRARRWLVLATVSAGLLLITLDNSVLYTALPELTADLGASPVEALWVMNAYPLVMAGLLLGAGTLGDRVGHTRMFVIGLVVFGLASLGAAFSTTPELLIAARAALAVGASAMMPATLALIRLTFDDERERASAIGVWAAVAVVSAALGPLLGGLLLEFFWWGSVFLINVPVVVVALIATASIAPRATPDRSRPWDALSSVYALIGLAGLVLALKEVTHGEPSWPLLALGVLLGGPALVLFVRRQRRLPYPLLDFALFRNPLLMAGVLAAGLTMFAFAGIQLVSTQHYQLVEGFTPLQSGLVVTCFVAGSLPGSLGAGALLARFSARLLLVSGLVVSAVGLTLALALMPLGLIGVLIGFVVSGLGLGLVMTVASASIVDSAPRHRAGMASSVEEVSYEFGGLLAVAALGGLLGSMATAFVSVTAVVIGVLALTTVAVAVLLRRG